MNANKFDAVCEILTEVFSEFLSEREDFCDVEADAFDFARKVTAVSLGRALEEFDDYLHKSGEFGRVKSKEKRSIITKSGEVSFRRRRYLKRDSSHIPLDEILALSTSSRLSPLATFEITTLALDLSYQKAANAFERTSGVKISKPAVGEAICVTAKAIEHKSEMPEKKSVLSLSVEGDGVWISLQHKFEARRQMAKRGVHLPRWQEVSLGCVYEGKERISPKRTVRINPVYTHSLSGHDDFWEKMSADIESRYCAQGLTATLLGTDGEAGYVRGRDYLPGRVIHSLDTWHVFRTVRTLARQDVSPEIIALIQARKLDGALLHLSGYRDVFRQEGKHKRAKDIQKLIKYLVKWEREILNGLTFSLGSIEGSISHVIAARCKTLGRSWSKRRLDGIVTCLTYIHSGNALPKRRRKQEMLLCIPAKQEDTDMPASVEIKKLNALTESHYYHQSFTKREGVRSAICEWDTLKKIF
jgi:hypothetical protein